MTQELTVTNIISLFEMTKVDRKSFIVRVIEAMESGNADPLKIHLQLKGMEKIIEGLTSTDEKKNADSVEFAKKYRKMVLDEAEKHGKDFEFHNAKVKIGEVGTKYDYSKCNDPEILELEKKAKEAAKALKDRQDFLQTVSSKGLDIMVGDELVKIYPPSKSSTTSVIVTLK